MATTKKPSLPAIRKAAGVSAKNQQTQFIDILKTDHKFDLIQRIVDHMGEIKRAKKIKPQEKHRLLQNYYLTLLSYCLPKIKVVEDNSDKDKKPINFQINIGGTAPTKVPTRKAKTVTKQKSGGVSITIPTSKNKDGSYSVTSDDQTD